jgi:hypothetical protein
VGQLAHDGPATPEQISLVLPVTGTLPDTATATVRYKESSSSQWLAGHPLFRVRPQFTEPPIAGGAVQDVFAWPIIDLKSGVSYDVEVAVRSGADVTVRTLLNHTTRSLPGPHGPVNKTANSAASIATQLAGLNPGDVLEIADGTYNVSNLTVSRSGTANQPIYIRGASRTGTVLRDTSGEIISVTGSHVIIENMTLQGSGTDSGTNASSGGVFLGAPATRITLRNLTMIGVDRGVDSSRETTQTLVYNNTLTGNNQWTLSPVNFLETNLTWNDEGIKIPGQGNAAFQNTISRFGDTFAYASHNSGAETNNFNIHYYRNDIRNSGDDALEADHGRRNLTWYDNRIHNSMNCDSLDPLYGGPWVSARNICINPYRSRAHKWNNNNSGQFLYNNTVIGTRTRDGDPANWYQPNNGPQRAYGYRNNIQIYFGGGQSVWLESGGHNPIDWTHNSWWPDRQIQWDGSVFGNLASAQSGLGNRTPIFSGTTRRMQNDNITESNPWTTTISLGPDSLTEVTATFLPVLRAGTSPKGSGVEIPNITDGHTGTLPDRGAIIEGRPVPQYGDCSRP